MVVIAEVRLIVCQLVFWPACTHSFPFGFKWPTLWYRCIDGGSVGVVVAAGVEVEETDVGRYRTRNWSEHGICWYLLSGQQSYSHFLRFVISVPLRLLHQVFTPLPPPPHAHIHPPIIAYITSALRALVLPKLRNYFFTDTPLLQPTHSRFILLLSRPSKTIYLHTYPQDTLRRHRSNKDN